MLKTFSIGGVHPQENKLSAHQPLLQQMFLQKQLFCLVNTSVLLQNQLSQKEIWLKWVQK